jgi:hypothetical protein
MSGVSIDHGGTTDPNPNIAPFAGRHAERTIGRVGSGNWDAFPIARLAEIYDAAEHWARELKGIEKPWLCWCVSNSWSVLQQKLIRYVNWTPIVGHDTNISKPVVIPGAIYVDFNAQLRLPRLYPHFVLEWIFLFADRLAFWHSDFLLSREDMMKAARCFEELQQGELAMPWNYSAPIMRLLGAFRSISNDNRLFEVVGCNTREASRQQFEEGTGFWRHPEKHPNNKRLAKDFSQWEHSVGVSLWARRHPDKLKLPRVDIRTGHAQSWHGGLGEHTSKQELLEKHKDILEYAKRLGIESF